jgi:transcription elongation factor Elf1
MATAEGEVRAVLATARLWTERLACPECGQVNVVATWYPVVATGADTDSRLVAVLCGGCEAFMAWEYDVGHLVDPGTREAEDPFAGLDVRERQQTDSKPAEVSRSGTAPAGGTDAEIGDDAF